jgi:hypothetical protein
MSTLDSVIDSGQISETLRCAIHNDLHDTKLSVEEYRSLSFSADSFFHWIYQRRCQSLCNLPQRNRLRRKDVLILVRCIRDNDGVKEDVTLKNRLSSEAFRLSAIAAASILAPVGIAGLGYQYGELLDWQPGHPLSETILQRLTRDLVLSKQFEVSSHSSVASRQTRIPRSLHLNNLQKIGGIDIVWTSNLLDHLRLIEDARTEKLQLLVFHSMSTLEALAGISSQYQQQGGPKSSATPRSWRENRPDLNLQAMIDETRDTLALLLPTSSNKAVQRWFDREQRLHQLDPSAGASQHYLQPHERSIEHYRIWRPRLAELKAHYDAHEPDGPSQWWHDRRKRVQWWTFWVAVLVLLLTIVFGLIQSVTGILQVRYAAKSIG